ncbi:hypothetical protein SOPP22_01350 [Shewanella sp. OPT22]|nr:hypothetical protein SOPP22_01350 [Shewanella sp. OPT22]
MKCLYFVILTLFSTFVFGNCDGNSCSPVKVTRLVLSSSGDISIGTSGDESKLSCNAGSNNYISLRKTHENFQNIYALLLASQMSEHSLWIRATNSGACEVIYVVSDK